MDQQIIELTKIKEKMVSEVHECARSNRLLPNNFTHDWEILIKKLRELGDARHLGAEITDLDICIAWAAWGNGHTTNPASSIMIHGHSLQDVMAAFDHAKAAGYVDFDSTGASSGRDNPNRMGWLTEEGRELISAEERKQPNYTGITEKIVCELFCEFAGREFPKPPAFLLQDRHKRPLSEAAMVVHLAVQNGYVQLDTVRNSVNKYGRITIQGLKFLTMEQGLPDLGNDDDDLDKIQYPFNDENKKHNLFMLTRCKDRMLYVYSLLGDERIRVFHRRDIGTDITGEERKLLAQTIEDHYVPAVDKFLQSVENGWNIGTKLPGVMDTVNVALSKYRLIRKPRKQM